jgi:hypothetical protein
MSKPLYKQCCLQTYEDAIQIETIQRKCDIERYRSWLLSMELHTRATHDNVGLNLKRSDIWSPIFILSFPDLEQLCPAVLQLPVTYLVAPPVTALDSNHGALITRRTSPVSVSLRNLYDHRYRSHILTLHSSVIRSAHHMKITDL